MRRKDRGQQTLAFSVYDRSHDTRVKRPPAPPMPQPLLRLSHLVKTFGGATVVNDLSLDIHPGECLGVIGPNGAGKTTMIRMCLGLAKPHAGTIEAFGLPIPQRVREAKSRIGVVTQFDGLDPDFTCA